MMAKDFDDSFFDDLSYKEIDSFINFYYSDLIGSPIFIEGCSPISFLIKKLTCKDKNATFIPTHVGIITDLGGELYIFNMKFPKASVVLLKDYLIENMYDKYSIFIRKFHINIPLFNMKIIRHIGEPYPIFSAIGSLFSKSNMNFRSPKKMHCSELYVRECRNAGANLDIDAECTPYDLYKYMENR